MRRAGAVIVVAGLLVGSVTPGLAAPLPSRAVAPEVQSDSDLRDLEAFLETRLVREALAGLGLTAEEVRDRLGRLSPAERHQLASQLDRFGTGAGAGHDTTILLIVLALVILLIALLI